MKNLRRGKILKIAKNDRFYKFSHKIVNRPCMIDTDMLQLSTTKRPWRTVEIFPLEGEKTVVGLALNSATLINVLVVFDKEEEIKEEN